MSGALPTRIVAETEPDYRKAVTAMKIRSHSESHIVELDDGTRWQVFPGDLDITLHWKPETELQLVRIVDEVSDQAVISADDEGRARVLPLGERWPAGDVQTVLAATKRGQRQTGR
jgi:hypothetical protein